MPHDDPPTASQMENIGTTPTDAGDITTTVDAPSS